MEGWAEVADVQRKASQLPIASFKKRAFAFLIDFTLILGITMAIVFIQELFSLDFAVFITQNTSTIIFITVGLLWLYSTLLEGFNGQSLGKRIIGLKVVRTDGKKMSYDHAAVRNFGKVLPLLPFDLIAGWRIKNCLFMRCFDKFSGTTVINLR